MVNTFLQNTETIVAVGPFPLEDIFNPKLINKISDKTIPKEEEREIFDHYETLERSTNSAELEKGDFVECDLREKVEMQLEDIVFQLTSMEKIVSKSIRLRRNKLLEIFLRPESVELLETISQNENPNRFKNFHELSLKSKCFFHAMADLISEDLLTLENGEIILTELCKRIIAEIIEGKIYDQS